jgi:hypothetical protein
MSRNTVLLIESFVLIEIFKHVLAVWNAVSQQNLINGHAMSLTIGVNGTAD